MSVGTNLVIAVTVDVVNFILSWIFLLNIGSNRFCNSFSPHLMSLLKKTIFGQRWNTGFLELWLWVLEQLFTFTFSLLVSKADFLMHWCHYLLCNFLCYKDIIEQRYVKCQLVLYFSEGASELHACRKKAQEITFEKANAIIKWIITGLLKNCINRHWYSTYCM